MSSTEKGSIINALCVEDDPEVDATATNNVNNEDGVGTDESSEEPQLPSFFAHRDEVINIILCNIERLKTMSATRASDASQPRLPYVGAVIVPATGTDASSIQAMFLRMEQLLAAYQEAPTLLLPHLEELMRPLLDAILFMMPRSIHQSSRSLCDGIIGAAILPTATTDEDASATTRQEESPSAIAAQTHALNALGQDYYDYDADSPKTALHNLCRALYFVVKVAGPKACTSHLPHDVKLLEDVFYCLRRWQTDVALKREWEVRYCFLLWLSSLVLVPFSFATIDSEIGGEGAVPLSKQLLECAWEFLSEPSKCREAAALLIARLNTRTDSLAHRQMFFTRALEAVRTTDNDNNMLRNGVLLAIATTHKFGKREELLQYSPELIPVVGEITHTSKDVKTAKTAVKVLQRLGLSLLKQRAASWRYRQRVVSLEANLANAIGASVNGQATSTDLTTPSAVAEADDDVVPEAIEDVIGYLLSALSHSDTIVRWSAAKGVGRLCARLPMEMATDVVLAVIEVFDAHENDCGWHGGLLALAELCRGSILLPEVFEKAMPLVAKGLHYELSRGSFSVGAHVRDAACYVCWSVARAYNPSDLESYAHTLSTALISTALFDREVNVRRAAAAAFQECVGRLGNFPNGIDLVTTMDFFSLATTRNAYLVVAPQVAKYDAYRVALMDHLFRTKLVHWDRAIRKFAATALATISVAEPDRAITNYFPKLVAFATETSEISIRHGSILAVAAMVGRASLEFPQADIDAAVNIIPTLDSKRYFRGRGVEFVRQACCSLVLNISLSKRSLPEHVEITKLTGQKAKAATKGNLQRFLEDSWKQPLEWLQWEAVDAFAAFAAQYYHPYNETFHAKVFTAMCQGTAEGKAPNERRGSTAALGALPLSIALAPLTSSSSSEAVANKCIYDEAFTILRSLLVVGPNKDEQDAETRRNAVKSIVSLSATLGAHLTSSILVANCVAITTNSFCDYAVDKRGDVGSYARTQALKDVPIMLCAAIEGGALSVDGDDGAKRALLSFVQQALKQSVEKIDRVRFIAGTSLKGLLTHATHGEAARAILATVVPPSDLAALVSAVVDAAVVDWASPQETFPPIVGKLLATPTFGPFIMEGLPVSVGGLSLHVSRSAIEAMCGAFAEDPRGLTRQLVEVAARYAHSERVVVPICLTIERLIEHSLFDAAYLPDVVDMLVVETKHFATDINRVLSFVPLLCILCQSSIVAVRRAAWYHALVLIASRYPKVRARVATDLYTAILMVSLSAAGASDGISSSPNWAAAMDTLTTTQWDDTDVHVVKGAKDALFSQLGLTDDDCIGGAAYAQGALAMTAADGLRANRTVRLGTYTSLVHEMGY